MSNDYQCGAATPPADLEARIMDINVPKNEQEWWARNEIERLRAELAASSLFKWQPIETAPTDNKRPLLLASFDDDGVLQTFDFDGAWEREQESWEMPGVYYYWGSAYGHVEEPTHWMYQPESFSKIDAARKGDE